jgi:hypothetical protein
VFNTGFNSITVHRVQDRLATAVFNTGFNSITVHRVQDRGGEPVSNMCLDTGPSFGDAVCAGLVSSHRVSVRKL